MSDSARTHKFRDNPKCILVLPTTHHTLLAEEVLRTTNIRHLPVPKPQQAVSDCGMAIQIEHGDLSHAAKALKRMDVRFFLKIADDEIEPIEPEKIL